MSIDTNCRDMLVNWRLESLRGECQVGFGEGMHLLTLYSKYYTDAHSSQY